MNLDNFKSAWNAENTDDVQIPKELHQLRKAQHPLEGLKRHMKIETYVQSLAIIILGFSPQIFNIHPSLYVIYYVAYVMLVVFSGYYFFGFRKFYQQISNYGVGTKDGLMEIYFELRLNIERYHSFGFLLLPFALVWIGVLVQSRNLAQGKSMMTIAVGDQFTLVIWVLIMTLLIVVAIQVWTNFYYGKYVKQLKTVLDELKEEN